MRLPLIDHIWRVRGDVPLDPALSPEEAFARLDPLLRTPGTTLVAEGNTLSYSKHNPAAQDKLATFTRGRMWIERAGAGGGGLGTWIASPCAYFCRGLMSTPTPTRSSSV